jgi:hypothetical protein
MAKRGGRPTPDYQRDVRNPTYHEAEERVYQWLLSRGKHVTDDRDAHTWHDFTIGHAWTLDVKTDTYGYVNGRVAWEQGIDFKNGRIADGWGMHHGLSYVVYVLLPPEDRRDGPWPILVCHADRLREFVYAHRETPVCAGFVTHSPDRDSFGYLLNLDALRACGAVLEEAEV